MSTIVYLCMCAHGAPPLLVGMVFTFNVDSVVGVRRWDWVCAFSREVLTFDVAMCLLKEKITSECFQLINDYINTYAWVNN